MQRNTSRQPICSWQSQQNKNLTDLFKQNLSALLADKQWNSLSSLGA